MVSLADGKLYFVPVLVDRGGVLRVAPEWCDLGAVVGERVRSTIVVQSRLWLRCVCVCASRFGSARTGGPLLWSGVERACAGLGSVARGGCLVV